MQRGKHLPFPAQLRFAILGLSFVFASPLADAADFTLTGFGTVGYAVTDSDDLQYLRYIDERGTFKVDSLLGVQAEARFSPRWSATVQAVASAPRDSDEGVEAEIRWAFVGFRPSNEWLVRLGRLRPPVFLYTQNAEVGVTYDVLRLPAELYALIPVYDVNGIALNRTWNWGADTEVNAEAYWGKREIGFRAHYERNPPAQYVRQRATSTGAGVSLQSGALLVRTSYHWVKIGVPGDEHHLRGFQAVPIAAPGQFGGTLYVPELTPEIAMRAFTLGVDWRPNNWRVTAEYGHLSTSDTDLLANQRGGYVSVARAIGSWTPYATYARLLSPSKARNTFKQLVDTPVPLAAQGPPRFIPDDFHRFLAHNVNVNDQYSIMLGAAYSFNPTSKLKLEWMRTRVGIVSNLVDGEVRNKSFNVFSVSYSAAF